MSTLSTYSLAMSALWKSKGFACLFSRGMERSLALQSGFMDFVALCRCLDVCLSFSFRLITSMGEGGAERSNVGFRHRITTDLERFQKFNIISNI